MTHADDLYELAPIIAAIPWDRLHLDIVREQCERSLAQFLREAWPHYDSSDYEHGWHIDAICEHLEAVYRAGRYAGC